MMLQTKKPLGLVRNKTQMLKKFKDDQAEKKKKSKKQGDLPITRKIQNIIKQERKQPPLLDGETKSGESTSSNYSIELSNRSNQPSYVTLFEETIDKIKKVRDLSSEIQKLGSKRARMTFGDTSSIEKQIYEHNASATKIIMECERNIQSIKQGDPDETFEDRKTRSSMYQSLAIQLQETANGLRNQQKRMVTLLNQVNKSDGGNFLKLSAQKESEMVVGSQLTVMEQETYDIAIQERDEDINRLVDMINGLATIFKQLNDLVIDQGTILDRIDYNVEQTVSNIQKANVQLRKADEYQDSPLAKRCIAILMFLIFVFCVILTFKYSG